MSVYLYTTEVSYDDPRCDTFVYAPLTRLRVGAYMGQ